MKKNIYTEMQIGDSAIVCGVMTGTSLDGVDVGFVEFVKEESGFSFKLLGFDVGDYPDGYAEFVKNCIVSPNWLDISFLHYSLPQIYAVAIRAAAEKFAVDISKLLCVSIHGQTIWHAPQPIKRFGVSAGATIQLGAAPALAIALGVPVAFDFRSADVALGGQGAPLAPIFDYHFLSEAGKSAISLNIGGMANLTYLPGDGDASKVIAFDSGPGNVLIDTAMKIFYDRKYDNNGEVALSGKINRDLLGELMSEEYINAPLPKSTGRELFNKEFLLAGIKKYELIPREDIITTLSEYTARSIALNAKRYACAEPDYFICAGGGAHNPYLMNALKCEFPNTEFRSVNNYGCDADSKEAVLFAYLGLRAMLGLPSNMPSVSGASSEAVLGCVYRPMI
jgi:anhydro-N-acetylmuramic acid kinase